MSLFKSEIPTPSGIGINVEYEVENKPDRDGFFYATIISVTYIDSEDEVDIDDLFVKREGMIMSLREYFEHEAQTHVYDHFDGSFRESEGDR